MKQHSRCVPLCTGVAVVLLGVSVRGIAGETRWPFLRHYDQAHLARIALPIGGIGTGTVSLGGRGNLRDWEIVNRPAKGFTPGPGFFVISVAPSGGRRLTRLLQGPVEYADYEGPFGARTSASPGSPGSDHAASMPGIRSLR
jgi:hypothetical protein